MIKVYIFTLPGPKLIVDNDFIFIQKFCSFWDEIAEVHVAWAEYIPPSASLLSNLVIHRQEYGGNKGRWFVRMLLRKPSDMPQGVDIFMNVAGHSSLGVLAVTSAIKTGKKSIVRVAGHDAVINRLNKNMLKFIAYKFGEMISLKYATKILTNSNDFVPYLIKKGANEKKLQVISSGVDTDLFRPQTIKKREQPTVLFVANSLRPAKRPFDFISVAAEVKKDFPEIRFLVISGAVGLEEARTFANKVGAKVEFLGYISQEDLPSYYSSSCVLLVTSASESLPRVALEAMACGTPVIATDVGGTNEVVKQDVTGKLVKVGDTAAMKESIIELCLDEKKRNKMGHNAQQLVEKQYGHDVLREKYISLLLETLDEG